MANKKPTGVRKAQTRRRPSVYTWSTLGLRLRPPLGLHLPRVSSSQAERVKTDFGFDDFDDDEGQK